MNGFIIINIILATFLGISAFLLCLSSMVTNGERFKGFMSAIGMVISLAVCFDCIDDIKNAKSEDGFYHKYDTVSELSVDTFVVNDINVLDTIYVVKFNLNGEKERYTRN